MQELVSSDGLFQVDEISDQIRNMLVTAFATWLGQSGLNFADFAANYQRSGLAIRDAIQADIQQFGLELPHFLVENISLPAEVEQALDRRVSMNVLGNLQEYIHYQAANAVEASATNPTGGNPALDLGVGLAMGQQIVNTMQSHATVTPAAQMAPPETPPPPLQPQTQWFITRDGQNFGPFTVNQLIPSGLTPQSYVWHAGMTGWQPAASLPELRSLFQTPPPTVS